ncbi:MAG TPA: protocatechuate 3,4-dioxygenase subunit alpha [Rhabdaerophilum sp.]|nr:protocatechuate 3,4-dioxygenase subunit alpha [Rhabdaerophilum sp.]
MPVEYLKETPSQTAGPYVHIGTLPAHAGLPVRQNETLNVVEAPGEKIVVEGIVLDGSGAPVKDAMLELYQATAKGEVGDATIWARAAAVFETGEWRFDTIRPGALEWRGGRMQAPHLTLLIFARGINIHLHTRMYFPEDEAAQAGDPALNRIEQIHRRRTLIAEKIKDGHYRFVIRLQGDQETVFFDM